MLDPDAPQPARRHAGRDDTAGSQARARSGKVRWTAELIAPTQAGLILSPAGRALAQSIAGQMHDPALMPYATRRNLLATAAALGIEPFEANLIIALHQHRSTRRNAAALDARRDRRPLPALVICVALEIAAVIGWYLLS